MRRRLKKVRIKFKPEWFEGKDELLTGVSEVHYNFNKCKDNLWIQVAFEQAKQEIGMVCFVSQLEEFEIKEDDTDE